MRQVDAVPPAVVLCRHGLCCYWVGRNEARECVSLQAKKVTAVVVQTPMMMMRCSSVDVSVCAQSMCMLRHGHVVFRPVLGSGLVSIVHEQRQGRIGKKGVVVCFTSVICPPATLPCPAVVRLCYIVLLNAGRHT